jgi:uncharacterized protein YbjT (DUF2867 family)
MKILLTGATGFIGGRLMAALSAEGHALRCVSRAPPAGPQPHPAVKWITLDYAGALGAANWAEALEDCDVVINAAGILRSRGRQTLERVHAQAPCALFEAARIRGVSRIIQISALGADHAATSEYHLTKRTADNCLRGMGVPYTILQPSLVFGPEGVSARLFMTNASLPVIPLPGGGNSMIQPVHIDDLVDAVLSLLRRPPADMPALVPVVGPRPMTLRGYYDALRTTLRIEGRARYLHVPMPLVAAAARVGDKLPGAMLSSETLDMLRRGNTADPGALQALLARPAKSASQFIPAAYARAMATRARMAWLLPMLRWSIAIVWLVTAAVSAFGYPISDSYALLRRAGVPDAALPLALYGAIVLDLLLGICAILPRRARWMWTAQAGLVIAYTVIISIRLPEYWLHPYGPLIKNVPFLAVLWVLWEMEDRPWKS